MTGAAATFTVVASGTPPLSYQWQKNGTNISEATPSRYTVTTTADNGATFAVVVSKAAGSVTSNSAALTMRPGTQKGSPTGTAVDANFGFTTFSAADSR